MSYILITGASSGIGYATAKFFLDKGHIVFGSVRKKSDASRLKSDFGESYIPLIFDTTCELEVKKSFQFVKKTVESKGLSALINNAGVAIFGPMQHISLEEMRVQFEVNVHAVVSITQTFLPLLGASNDSIYPKGKLFVISSVSGRVTRAFLGSYSGSKHAIEAIFDAYRRELMIIYGIPVVIIEPGPIKTDIWGKAKKEKDKRFKDTDYDKIFDNFKKEVEQIEKIAIPSERVAKTIYKAYRSKKPKTRYVVTPKRFFVWMAMHIIPDKLMDRIQFKQVEKLLKK